MPIIENQQNLQPYNMHFTNYNHPWKVTGKKKYQIWVCLPGPGVTVHNNLEFNSYMTDERKCVVLSGTSGEQWTTSLDTLMRTYNFATGEAITPESLERHKKHSTDGWMKIETIPGRLDCYALHIPYSQYKDIPIATGWGEILIANSSKLKHHTGDFLVCNMLPDGSPNFSDLRVINGVVFQKTYNMTHFQEIPKLPAERGVQNNSTPRPAALIVENNIADKAWKFLKQFDRPQRKFYANVKFFAPTLYKRIHTEPYITLETASSGVEKEFYIIFMDMTYGVIEQPNVSIPTGCAWEPEKLNFTNKQSLIDLLTKWNIKMN